MKTYRELLPSWAGRGACASSGQLLDDFFSEETSAGEATGQVFKAKRMCGGCEVRRECLDWAFQHEETETRAGIFGGLTPEERQEIASEADPVVAGLALFDEQATMYPDLRPRRKR